MRDMEPLREDLSPRPALLVAAVTSGLAGLVHAAAAGSHRDERTLVRLFAIVALAQVGWALVAWGRPHRMRLVLVAGIAINIGCAGAWGLTRVTGLPIDGLRVAESAGPQDLGAALLALVSVGAAITALVLPATPARRAGTVGRVALVAASLVVGFPLVASAGTHAHVDAHGDTHGAAAGAVAHGAGGHAHAGVGAIAATGPVTSLDDPRLSPAQQEAAQSLLERTTAAVLTRYPTRQAALAAGYRTIGDGRRPGSFEHLVNSSYLTDGRTLDPTRVESLVLAVGADGTKTVASAMYILESGSTMADVPDIAGELTVWHDHQNLCWKDDRIAGVVRSGRCVPGGELRATAPMLHVWLTPQTCGPFSGIEGHGQTSTESCGHGH